MSNSTFPCPTLTLDDVSAGDTAWMITASALVLLMTPGLGFFYGGLVKNKNVINTLMMSYAAIGVVMVHWVLFGYSFAFGPGSAVYGDFKFAGLKGVGGVPYYPYGSTTPLAAHMNYQMMFAVITPALISGGIVERVKFTSYLAFILVWTTIVYDPLAHMMWSSWLHHVGDDMCVLKSGWLKNLGALDFAGGTVIHISSGFSALVAAAIVGKRAGYNPKETQKAGNIPHVLLGTGLLWFGWLGFNGGSAGAATGVAVTAAANTSIAAATAFTTWLCIDMVIKKQPSATGASCGAVVGLVAITPASGYVSPSFAILFGIIPVAVVYASMKMKSKFSNLDDSLDVFYVHGVGGIVGSFMTGLFASKDANPDGENGAFFGNPRLIGIQILAIIITILIAVFISALILGFIKHTIGLALDQETAEKGVDAYVHGENAIDLNGLPTIPSTKIAPTASFATTTSPDGPIHYRAWDRGDDGA